MSEKLPQEEEVDLSLVKQILVTNPQQTNIISSLNKLISDQRQIKIIHQLINANLYDEVLASKDTLLLGFNSGYYMFAFFTSFLFKRFSRKMVYILGTLYFKYQIFTPIETEYLLRKQAKNNTLLGQEIRNLYRFYHHDQQFVQAMHKQCQDYLETQKIRKEIHRHRL